MRSSPETELRSLLNEVLPAGAAIGALECKQTLCRLETTHPDQGNQATFVQAFLFARPGQERPYGGALFDEPAASPDDDGVRSTTYLLRSGYDMPAHGTAQHWSQVTPRDGAETGTTAKMIADRFGMALRTYHARVARIQDFATIDGFIATHEWSASAPPSAGLRRGRRGRR